MKITKIVSLLLLAFSFMACEENLSPLFDAGKYANVSFSESSYSVAETSTDTLLIPVVVAGEKGTKVEISFSTDTVASNTAKLGEDYLVLNTDNKLTVEDGIGIAYIEIVIIDNGVYTKDKYFSISLASNSAGYYMDEDGLVTVKIMDDEHPLAIVLGEYAEVDYLYADDSPENAMSPYDVSITPIDGSETTVSILNFWGGGDYTITANVDIENKTISILPGQVIYVYETYGDCIALAIIDDSYDDEADIVGTFDDDGNITINTDWAAHVSLGDVGVYSSSVLTKK